ncbi:MAG: hypothetical protein RL447_1158 [Bacteroidota bacterium]|jgi:MerR family copper efflux transcriptional regulator
MLINELSKRSGVSVHTIRFYEKSGLIKGYRNEQVLSNNYFHYDDEVVEKLEFIQDAKSVGFTIKEIGQVIGAWYTDAYTQKEKLSILNAKLVALDIKLKEIRNMKKKIEQFKQDVTNNLCR